jgi:hypothetical protein
MGGNERSVTMMLSAPPSSSSPSPSFSSTSTSLSSSPTRLNDIILIGCQAKVVAGSQISSSYQKFERYSHSTRKHQGNDQYDNGQLRKWSPTSISTWLWMVSVKWMEPLAKSPFRVINNEWLLIPSFDADGSYQGYPSPRTWIVHINDIGDAKKWRWYERIPRVNAATLVVNLDFNTRRTYLVVSDQNISDGHHHRCSKTNGGSLFT